MGTPVATVNGLERVAELLGTAEEVQLTSHGVGNLVDV